MARLIEVEPQRGLGEHEDYAHLAGAVKSLRREAKRVRARLEGRRIRMVNSTAQGGGVSEMLPGVVAHLNELGIATEWIVIEADDPHFFEVTKRIHNMIHGEGRPGFEERDRAVFEATNGANAAELAERMRPGDVLAVHDPQPMPLASMLRERLDIVTIWRCHIGLDEETEAGASAWEFLRPYADAYDHAIFSAPEYVPDYFEGRSSIVYPSLDPLAEKNRPMHVQDVVATLFRAALLRDPGPHALDMFSPAAQRLQADGSWAAATKPDDPGLLTRPIITQVSRWDRLKGFLPLMQGFARLRRRTRGERVADPALRRHLPLARLLLVGPDPRSVADDPEGTEVLDELRAAWLELDSEVRKDILLIALPMEDPAVNALMVNALQRVSTIVVQNSLREGFGLTITEAMWKGVPVLSNSLACGPRQQIREDADGVLIRDPADPDGIADALEAMLADPDRLVRWGRSAERRVHDHFLIYTQLRHWLRLIGRLVDDAKTT